MKKLVILLSCLSLGFLTGCATSSDYGGSYENEPQDGASLGDTGCSS
jgi:hypothetical protein